jgi:hypothetical protein
MPHKHSRNSNWQKRRSLYQAAREELHAIYDKAYRDPDISEVVALKESVLLDVDQGEVLRTPVYTRTFDVFSRR